MTNMPLQHSLAVYDAIMLNSVRSDFQNINKHFSILNTELRIIKN